MSRTRGIVLAVSGLLIVTFNVIDAAVDGVSVWNIVSIVIGAFLLFYGIMVVQRTSRRGSPSQAHGRRPRSRVPPLPARERFCDPSGRGVLYRAAPARKVATM
jgi:hypothetical protein